MSHETVYDLTSEQVAVISEWARARLFIAEIRLFGSRFKLTSGPYSDVDLAFTITPITRGLRKETPFDIYMACASAWEAELSQRIGLAVDIERYEESTAPNVWRFVNQGHFLIYQRDFPFRSI